MNLNDSPWTGIAAYGTLLTGVMAIACFTVYKIAKHRNETTMKIIEECCKHGFTVETVEP